MEGLRGSSAGAPGRLIGESILPERGVVRASDGFAEPSARLRRMDFGTVIWIVVLVIAPIAAVLFAGAFGLLDQLGRGDLAIEESPARRPAPAVRGPAGRSRGRNARPRSASSSRLATTARRVAASRPSTSSPKWPGSWRSTRTATQEGIRGGRQQDAALRLEVRQLVIARNERRAARGEPPLDVEAEVERQMRDWMRPDAALPMSASMASMRYTKHDMAEATPSKRSSTALASTSTRRPRS